ncbi:MAG: SMP-30/gluconolactonase/LRE family protein [Saprospiraceae bacterium]|nr:SMP-30/gluconolactonase/LRE family protein [Saprospiraceae bacterium]
MKELTVDGRRWTVNGATSWLPSAVHTSTINRISCTHYFQNPPFFADGLDHPECVAVHPDGTVWAGGEAGQIYRISADGKKVEEVANTGGFILGLAFSPGAKWLAICDLGKKCVWRLDLQTMKLERFADGAEGHKFNIPNYAVFDKQGNLYVSESGAFRQITGKVLKFSPNGSGTIWHDGGFNFANGMALCPEGSTFTSPFPSCPGWNG